MALASPKRLSNSCSSHSISFVNAPHIDFTNVDGMSPTQEFDLSQQATDGPVQYNLKSAKFFNVNSLTLFFEKSHGSPTTEINFIGFQGEFSQVQLSKKHVLAWHIR